MSDELSNPDIPVPEELAGNIAITTLDKIYNVDYTIYNITLIKTSNGRRSNEAPGGMAIRTATVRERLATEFPQQPERYAKFCTCELQSAIPRPALCWNRFLIPPIR